MNASSYPSGEFELIARLQNILGKNTSPYYSVGIGDDAAVRTDTSGNTLVITTDLSVENVHFCRDYMTMREIGYRAMVSNISDCAAMGAVPDSAFVQVVIPDGTASVNDLEEMYHGFNEACTRWQFSITGGDLSRGREWVIGITLIGHTTPPERVLLRTGIQKGDNVYLSGIPGRSAAGLYLLQKYDRTKIPAAYAPFIEAHVRPVPHVELGRFLSRNSAVHAMMDLSDGLSKDCRTLCYENHCGMVLYNTPSLLPGEMVQLSSEEGIPWQKWYFNGGEEYELLFTASDAFDPASCPGYRPICIGRCTASDGELLIKNDNSLEPLAYGGYDHVRAHLK